MLSMAAAVFENHAGPNLPNPMSDAITICAVQLQSLTVGLAKVNSKLLGVQA